MGKRSVRFSGIGYLPTPNIISLARRTLAETEKSQEDNAAARKAAEKRVKELEKRARNLESKLDEEGRESSDIAISRKHLEEALEDEREQHKKDLAERDFTTDQTRKKYQGERVTVR